MAFEPLSRYPVVMLASPVRAGTMSPVLRSPSSLVAPLSPLLLRVAIPITSDPLTVAAPDAPTVGSSRMTPLLSVAKRLTGFCSCSARVTGSATQARLGAVTVTVVLATPRGVPLGALQVRVKVVELVMAPVLALPLVALFPDQPPEAVQLVALNEDQVR